MNFRVMISKCEDSIQQCTSSFKIIFLVSVLLYYIQFTFGFEYNNDINFEAVHMLINTTHDGLTSQFLLKHCESIN